LSGPSPLKNPRVTKKVTLGTLGVPPSGTFRT